MRLAVCDDDPRDLQALLELLGGYGAGYGLPAPEAVPFSSCEQLLGGLDGQPPFDAFVLDIVMPGVDGLAAARRLRAAGAGAPVVFVTASAAYALEAWRVHALRYLVKPVRREELYEALDAVRAAGARRAEVCVPVKTPEGLLRLEAGRIVSVQNVLHNIEYTLCDCGQPVRSTTCREPFLQSVRPLLVLPQFEQTHKSYLVNFERVRCCQPCEFVMCNGQVSPSAPNTRPRCAGPTCRFWPRGRSCSFCFFIFFGRRPCMKRRPLL